MKNTFLKTSVLFLLTLFTLIGCEKGDTQESSKQNIINVERSLLAEQNALKSVKYDSIKSLSYEQLIEFENQVQKKFKESKNSEPLNPVSIKWQEIILKNYIGPDKYYQIDLKLRENAVKEIINQFIAIENNLKTEFKFDSSDKNEIIAAEEKYVLKREGQRKNAVSVVLNKYLN